MELYELTIKQTHDMLKKKEISAMELLRAFLDRIENIDKDIQAYLTITRELAEEQARKTDWKLMKNEPIGLLEGIPAAIKDNILVRSIRCTAASRILENYVAPYDATVIKKLKDAGAVIIGKTNMDEFAMGASTENSAFFATKNPHDLERVPGGSSGGSAAAVAARECAYALGSDTAGSIRQPASFCGVVGLKPTYGSVSRYGLISMGSSLDQIGPIAQCVEDAAIVFNAIYGKDMLDSTSVDSIFNFQFLNKFKIQKSKIKNVNEKLKIGDLRVGVPKEYFGEGIDRGVENVVKKAIARIEEAGAKIEEISLFHTKYAVPAYYTVMPSEVSANLARYDGIKYGASATANSQQPTANNLLDVYFQTRGRYFGKEVRRRIMLGTYALSSGYYDAYYLRAQKIRAIIKKDFEDAFEKIDFIVTPTSPTLPFKLGEKSQNPLSMYLADIYTAPLNLAGLPGLSLPCGQIGKLPVGFQIIGPWFSEDKILEFGRLVELLMK